MIFGVSNIILKRRQLVVCICVAACFLFGKSFGQNRKTDSLYRILKIARADSDKVNLLNQISFEFRVNLPDTSYSLATKSLEIAKKAGFDRGIGNAEMLIATYHKTKSNYQLALRFNFKALEIWQRIFPPSGGPRAAYALSNIGIIYDEQSDYPKALKYHFKTLAIAEGLGNKALIASALTNIGLVHNSMGDYSKALEYHLKSLELKKEIGNKLGIANTLNNIGIVFSAQQNYPQALKYFFEVLKISEEVGDQKLTATTLINIGSVYESTVERDKALQYLLKAVKVNETLGNKKIDAAIFGNVSNLYRNTGRYEAAEEYLKKALDISYSMHFLDYVSQFELNYCKLDSAKGDFKTALEHYRKYIAVRDSVSNEENTKKQIRLEMQFYFDKKQTADSILVVEEKKVAAAILRTEKNKSYSLYGGLGLVLIFSGFLYNRFRVTRKQKNIIEDQKLIVEEQKKIVEEKQKDILDSIHYAERIQRSLLPTTKYISRFLK